MIKLNNKKEIQNNVDLIYMHIMIKLINKTSYKCLIQVELYK